MYGKSESELTQEEKKQNITNKIYYWNKNKHQKLTKNINSKTKRLINSHNRCNSMHAYVLSPLTHCPPSG